MNTTGLLIAIGIAISSGIKAQKVDSIYVHLYTDSLKKGTYNYINIDGRLQNGRYIPLDTTLLVFSSSHGKFTGNTLWIEPDTKEEKVAIEVMLKNNPAVKKAFTLFIKKKEDGPLLQEADIRQHKQTGNRKN